MTFSVHDSTIFPGHGPTELARGRRAQRATHPGGAGDDALLAAIDDVVVLAEAWQPDVVLVAVGAEGHGADPLSTLQYTYDGYRHVGRALGRMAAALDAPVLMGGARRLPAAHAHPGNLGDLRRGAVPGATGALP